MMLIGPTLGRYFAARFLRTVLGVFVTVFALVYTLDFVELLRRAGEAQGASAGLMAQLSLYRTPAVAEGVLPFAILFGSMAALLQLSRKLELVVARAAGISAWQFLQPGFFVALTLGALAVGVYNPVSALLKQRSTEIEAKIFAKSTKASSGKDLWIRQKGLDGEAILRAETAIEGTTTLAGVSVFTFDAAGKFAEQLVAARATLHDGYWELSDVRVLTPDTPPESFDTYLIASNLDPAQVRQGFTPRICAFLATSHNDRADRAGRFGRHPIPAPVRCPVGKAGAVRGHGHRRRNRFLTVLPLWWCRKTRARWRRGRLRSLRGPTGHGGARGVRTRRRTGGGLVPGRGRQSSRYAHASVPGRRLTSASLRGTGDGC